MGASLLVMVCGLTRKKKSYEADWPELEKIERELAGVRDTLLALASKDADSYDKVLEAIRSRKTGAGTHSAEAYDAAVREATEIPRKTATASIRVLELAVKVAAFGSRSAASDTGVGIRLAEAGVRGAALNILINLKDSTDPSYVRTVGEELMSRGERASALMKEALAVLERA